MKRIVSWAATILAASAMGGCPVFPDSSGCFGDRDCAPGYSCNLATGACVSSTAYGSCARPSDCGVNETCDRTGTCKLGDCSVANIGCVSGYTCEVAAGVWACEPSSSLPDASLGYGGTSSAAGAAGASASSQGGASGAGAQTASGGSAGSGGVTNAGAAGATSGGQAGASGAGP